MPTGSILLDLPLPPPLAEDQLGEVARAHGLGIEHRPRRELDAQLDRAEHVAGGWSLQAEVLWRVVRVDGRAVVVDEETESVSCLQRHNDSVERLCAP